MSVGERKALADYDQPVRVAISMLRRSDGVRSEVAAELEAALGGACEVLASPAAAPFPRMQDALEALEDVLRGICNNAKQDHPRVGFICSPEPLALGWKLLRQIEMARERGELPALPKPPPEGTFTVII